MKKYTPALIAGLLVLSLSACGGSGEGPVQSSAPGITIQITRESPSPSAEPAPAEALPLELGTAVQVPEYAELTLVRVTTTQEVRATMDNGIYYENNNDGEIYVDAVFDVVNHSGRAIPCDELLEASATGSGGEEYDHVLYCGEKDDMGSISTGVEIAPLSTGRIHAALSVPESETSLTLYFDVNGTRYTCGYDTQAELKLTTPLKVGDVVENADYASMEFLGYEFTEAVYPTNTNGYYRYYKVDNSDNTYLALTFQITNYQSTAKEIDTFLRGRAVFMEKYKYNGFVVSENSDGSSLSNYNDIQPLSTARVICLIEVPKSVAQEAFTVSLMFDGQEYTMSAGA